MPLQCSICEGIQIVPMFLNVPTLRRNKFRDPRIMSSRRTVSRMGACYESANLMTRSIRFACGGIYQVPGKLGVSPGNCRGQFRILASLMNSSRESRLSRVLGPQRISPTSRNDLGCLRKYLNGRTKDCRRNEPSHEMTAVLIRRN